MKTSIMKRSLSILLSVMMIVGVFVSTAAISADAALSGEQMSSEYQITINDVTRKYPLAKQLLDGINAERTTRGLVTLRMDSALMEQTMVRAAELPLYFSKYSLMEDDYSLKAIMYEDYSSQHYFEGVFVMRGSVSEAVSAFFSDSNYSAVVTNSYAKEIGIGAVEVGSNNVTFICLRTTDEMTDKGTYRAVDSSVYSSETTIDQTTNTLGKNMDAFYYKREGARNWVAMCDEFGSATDASFRPKYEEKYFVKSVAKDERDKTAEKIFEITVRQPEPGEEIINNSTVTELIEFGDRVYMTGSAEGGTGSYTYTYEYRRSGNTKWRTIGTADTTLATASFKPIAAGTLCVRITVKDSTGNSAVKEFTVNVSE